MKKKVIFSILLIIFSAFILLYKKNITDAAEQSPFTMYGFKISIIKYTGVGEPTRLGKPILVYPKGMMEGTTEDHPSSMPSNREELHSGAYDLTQIVEENNEDTIVKTTSRTDKCDEDYCKSQIINDELDSKANRSFDIPAKFLGEDGEIAGMSFFDVIHEYTDIIDDPDYAIENMNIFLMEVS